MSNTQKTVVEISGQKFEVDMREAKAITHMKVGDAISVLHDKGEHYTDRYLVCPGVVVGFEDFKDLPTVNICYLQQQYNEAELKVVGINKDSKIKIAPRTDDILPTAKSYIIDGLDREIVKAEAVLEDANRKKEYFLRNFGMDFTEVKEDE